jgi:NADH-quinone oxidoreductase subunit M
MNLAILGLFTINIFGFFGAFYLMFGHGFISSALFFSIGVLYDRYHTRVLFYFGGLSSTMPLFASFFLFFSFSNVGFPATFNFISELFILEGILLLNFFIIFILFLGFVLTIIYSIWLYNRIFFGTLKNNYIGKYSDLNILEFLIIFFLFIFTIFFGIDSNMLTSNLSF